MFPAFICAINIGSIVNNLLGVKFFNPVLVVFLFQGFNFTLSAIIFSGSSTSSSSYVAISGKLVEISGKSRFNISGSFRTFTFPSNLHEGYYIELCIHLKTYHII